MRLLSAALLLTLATPAFAAEDPNVTFVENTLQQFQMQMQKPEDKARMQGVCRLLSQKLGNSFISDRWLGRHIFLERETFAINQLRTMVPSIVFSKFLQNLSVEDAMAKLQVVGASRKKSNGLFEVDVEVLKSNGEKHLLTFVVWTRAGRKLVDFIMQDKSAAQTLGAEYGKIVQQEFDRDPQNSMPITTLVEFINQESGFVRCF